MATGCLILQLGGAHSVAFVNVGVDQLGKGPLADQSIPVSVAESDLSLLVRLLGCDLALFLLVLVLGLSTISTLVATF